MADVQKINAPGLGRLPAFSHASVAGDTIYVSGTLGTKPDSFELVDGGMGPQTRQTLENIKLIVESAGAQKDIFPSIHTAAPTFAFLFSFHNRSHLPYRYSWPVLGFFVCNIIVATMFLRWHWLLDIVAGIFLAVVAQELSVVGTRWERRRRSELGLQPAWPPWPGATP